jgi:DNA-binding IclR family transcriptional regulator
MRSVARFAKILRATASADARGLTLAELARACDLDKATTLRLTRALAEQGWLRAGIDGRWRIGEDAWLVGRRAAPRLQAVVDAGMPRIARLGSRTGDTIYLAVGSGVEVVVLARVDGRVPVRATIEPGARQLMILGASGMAWMAALPPDEAHRILDSLAPRMKSLGMERMDYERRLVKSRRDGHAFTSGSRLYGVPAISMAVRDAGTAPLACVTISGNTDRLTAAHVASALPLLQKCVKAIEMAVRTHRFSD